MQHSGERSTTVSRTTGYGLFSQETHNLLRLVLDPELATDRAEGLVVNRDAVDLNYFPLFPAKYMAPPITQFETTIYDARR
jgi:hypothetical protein